MGQTKSRIGSLAEQLRSLPIGTFTTLDKIDRGGSLQARRLSTGAVQFYWRYSHQGRTYRELVGPYDISAPPKKLAPSPRGYSLAAAREQCRALAARHIQHIDDGGLREAKEQQRRQVEQKKTAAAAVASRTLACLLEDYVQYLKVQGRRSAKEAKGIFDLHAVGPWPITAAMPACDVSQDQILDMLRRLIEQNKGRTANKLRSYLRAAYQCAIDVRVIAAIPVAFKAYGVTVNPVAQTRRDARFDLADKCPLTLEELQRYWRIIQKEPGLRGQCLRLHLLTGGQRIDQLVRLRWVDALPDRITILDTKGRPGQGPRRHTVPLVKQAAQDLSKIPRLGTYVMSTTEGKKPIVGTTLSGWAKLLVGNAIEGFQLKRIRSGVETLLAARGINLEIRGQLQSHGLTGIQARHYDGHDYMTEKRQSLELLADALIYKRRRSNRTTS